MTDSINDIKTAYPLPLHNFRVEVGTDAVAFSEVSGLSIEYEVTTFKESRTSNGTAGPRVIHMPSQAQPVNVIMRKGIAPKVSVANLYDWISGPKGIKLNQVLKQDVVVRLCDEAGAPRISWKIRNAFPTKLDGPTFDATSNDVAFESLELRGDSIVITED